MQNVIAYFNQTRVTVFNTILNRMCDRRDNNSNNSITY